jgi:hypothetical protein
VLLSPASAFLSSPSPEADGGRATDRALLAEPPHEVGVEAPQRVRPVARRRREAGGEVVVRDLGERGLEGGGEEALQLAGAHVGGRAGGRRGRAGRGGLAGGGLRGGRVGHLGERGGGVLILILGILERVVALRIARQSLPCFEGITEK